MDGEVTFRRAVIGGFNRDDVLQYISSIASSNSEYQKLRVALKESEAKVDKLQAELDSINREAANEQTDCSAALEESEATIAQLRAEIEAKNQEIEMLKGNSSELDELKQRLEEYESKTSEFDGTAEKLMRESMTYADRYVESANLMAANVRKETLAKVVDADERVREMVLKADVFSNQCKDFESMLSYFKTQLDEIRRTFE